MVALRAGLLGALVGFAIGLVARVPMRWVALVRDEDTDFTVSGTVGIGLTFAVAGLGAALAGAGTERRWLAAVIVVLTTLPMALFGAGVGQDEVRGALRDGVGTVRVAGVLLLTVLVGALAAAAPVAGWRIGRRLRAG